MTSQSAFPRITLLNDSRTAAELQALGFVPVAEATVDSTGVFANCPDIPAPEQVELVPVLLSPERVESAVTDENGVELTPAVRIEAQYEQRKVVLQAASIISGSVEEQRLCAEWLATLPPLVIPEPVPEPPAPHRVLKDTIMLRIEAAGMLEGFMSVAGSLSPVQRFKWDQSSWFMSDNTLLIDGINALGLDPVIIMADDPLAP